MRPPNDVDVSGEALGTVSVWLFVSSTGFVAVTVLLLALVVIIIMVKHAS